MRRAWSPERPHESVGRAPRRPGGGDDSCDPAPSSHLEHVAGSGGSGRVTPASAPPTIKRRLRRPGRALFPRPRADCPEVDAGKTTLIREGLVQPPLAKSSLVELQRVAPGATDERKPHPFRVSASALAVARRQKNAGSVWAARGGTRREALGICLRGHDWAPHGVR